MNSFNNTEATPVPALSVNAREGGQGLLRCALVAALEPPLSDKIERRRESGQCVPADIPLLPRARARRARYLLFLFSPSTGRVKNNPEHAPPRKAETFEDRRQGTIFRYVTALVDALANYKKRKNNRKILKTRAVLFRFTPSFFCFLFCLRTQAEDHVCLRIL